MIPQDLIGKFPQEQLERLYAPPKQSAMASTTRTGATLADIKVTTANGRVFNLGAPRVQFALWSLPSPAFHIRRLVYLMNYHYRKLKGAMSWLT